MMRKTDVARGDWATADAGTVVPLWGDQFDEEEHVPTGDEHTAEAGTVVPLWATNMTRKSMSQQEMNTQRMPVLLSPSGEPT